MGSPYIIKNTYSNNDIDQTYDGIYRYRSLEMLTSAMDGKTSSPEFEHFLRN